MSTRRTPRKSSPPNAITITRQDQARLEALIERCGDGPLAALASNLEDELARAQVVEQTAIPPDIVTMSSTCVFRFADTGEEREVTLVYPDQADVAAQKISVLAPIGAALLGLGVGQTIRWPTPSGDRPVELIAVRYQPEAAGDFHL